MTNGYYEFKYKVGYCIFQNQNNRRRRSNQKSNNFNEKKIIFLAGLYDKNCFLICTKKSTEDVFSIHTRMPVILSKKEEIEMWLNYREVPQSVLEKNTFNLDFYEVAPFLFDVKEKGSQCLMSLEEYQEKNGMGRFFKSSKKRLQIESESEKNTQKINLVNSRGNSIKKTQRNGLNNPIEKRFGLSKNRNSYDNRITSRNRKSVPNIEDSPYFRVIDDPEVDKSILPEKTTNDTRRYSLISREIDRKKEISKIARDLDFVEKMVEKYSLFKISVIKKVLFLDCFLRKY